MLRQRLLVTIVMIPVGLGMVALGGIPYGMLVVLLLSVAAWEYVRLFQKVEYRPAMVLVVGGTALLSLARILFGLDWVEVILVALILLAMVYHLVAYEKGDDRAAINFGITLGGILYIGLLGAYLISLRNLPEGKWYFMIALPSIWFADGGAYFIGSHYGKHAMTPRLSPHKTWEGYLGGVVTGTLGGMLVASIWHLASPDITWFNGAWIGLVISLLCPLGDLGESMIKRQAGAKDSSNILPGHGGIFDRLDSWIWAGVVGYYLVIFLIH